MAKKIYLIMLVTLCVLTTVCFASNITFGEEPIPGLERPVGVILGMIQWVGFVVGIGMVIWIGIKYITAGATGKAEVKSTMVPWLAGAALIVLASSIAKGVYNTIGKSNTSENASVLQMEDTRML